MSFYCLCPINLLNTTFRRAEDGLQQSIENNQGQVNCVAFSPDGQLLASAGHDGKICLWNLEGELIINFEEHQDRVWSIAFSTDGNLLVSGSHDGRVFLWDVKGNALIDSLVRLEELQQNVYGVAFHPNMRFIASAGQSEQIDIWDIAERQNIDGRTVYSLESHQGIVSSIAFSLDGKLLASCSDDRTIKIWSWQTQELIRTIIGHTDWVNAIAFSPDGKNLISASSDLTLRLWDTDGNLINVFEGHTDSISSVAFHPSGDIIASGSRDGTVRIWNLQGDCLEVLTNEHQTNVRTVAFNPQGTILAIGGENQPINLYSQETSKLKTFTFKVATIAIRLEFKIVTLVPKEQIKNQLSLEEINLIEQHNSEAYGTPSGYASYQILSSNEREGTDYRIETHQGITDAVIIAPHGGKIEPGATEIAKAIAGEDHGFYSLEGLKPGNNHILSIPSEKFDEPRALELVGQANQVIAIHGFFYVEKEEFIYLEGLDTDLTQKIEQNLNKQRFKTKESAFEGANTNNICNRGKTGKGVQIGIPWGIRKQLFDSLKSESNEPTLFDRFVQAIRDALSPLEAAGWRSQIREGEADYYTEDLGNGIELDMISIPGGNFMMGTEEEEIERLVKKFDWKYFRAEKPQHEVTVQPFFMGKYPITQAQYQQVMGENPSEFKGDERPVEQVSWEDAVEFCQRLSQQTGKEYRLPTEAEWEYACRAGTTSAFHFGETITDKLANYNAGQIYAGEPKGEYRRETTSVGKFPPNAFGLYDMHGNVWEWCEDDWHKNYQGAPTDGSARVSGVSSNKVIRGGSWINLPHLCRSAYRLDVSRGDRDYGIGFRVVCVAPRTT